MQVTVFPSPSTRDFYLFSTPLVARRLLGCVLALTDNGGVIRSSGRIVECEAYLADDAASHSYRGPTARNSSMFRIGGTAYIYRIYGVHRCFNVVTGPEGIGEAVLIRALEPLEGVEDMRERRYGEPERRFPDGADFRNRRYRELCAGPGRICAAFGIAAGDFDGTDLIEGRLRILPGPPVPDTSVVTGPRIGISAGKNEGAMLRFGLRDSPYLSRPFPG